MNDDVKKIVGEYSEEYCLLLETAYGADMMSEGSEQAIEKMFSKEDLHNKKLLDIGFGLGGVAFYLADKYNAHVSGVEINPWMVEEATRRVPAHLSECVFFSEYHPQENLPFASDFFDVVFSKGVLTHLKNKRNLFSEVKRVLKSGGVFIIDDWLSPEAGKWGDRLEKMCEAEGLTLYAETENNYKALLKAAEFVDIDMREENASYYQYNMEIIDRLNQDKTLSNISFFDQKAIDDLVRGHQLIADSIRDNELLIRWFKCVKP